MADTPQTSGADPHAAPRAADRGSDGAGLVSVVIACYNAADFVAAAIESALAQTHPVVEVVVVDDASTDASWEVVAGFGERVTALRLPANRGPSHARNRGVELARGEWLMFLDADDFIAPDTLAGLVEAGLRAPGSLAACPWEFLQQQADGGWIAQAPRRPFAPVGDPLAGWLTGHWTPPCAVLYPRRVFLSAGGFDEALRRNEDGDLAMRAFVGGAGVRLATRGKSFYRRHLDPHRALSTDDRSGAGLRSQLRVLDKLVALLESQGRLDEYRPLVEVQYGHVANHAFPVGDFAVARECLARGGRGAAGVVRSSTLAGRLLTAALGLERKQRIIRRLRRWRASLRGTASRGG
jgi:glycosyltransferase involved in cell wall biosynthesis